jgi:hypothetical protein
MLVDRPGDRPGDGTESLAPVRERDAERGAQLGIVEQRIRWPRRFRTGLRCVFGGRNGYQPDVEFCRGKNFPGKTVPGRLTRGRLSLRYNRRRDAPGE